MVRRSTWILLVIFILLVAFAWWFQGYQSDQAENVPTGTPTQAKARVFDLSTVQVQDVSISSPDGDQVVLYHDSGSARWAVMDAPVEQADSFKIEAVVGQLVALEIEDTLPGNPALGPVGLEQPQFTITLRDVDGSQHLLQIGAVTPIGSGYYAQLDSGEIVVVDNLVVDNVIALLAEPPLKPTPTPETTPTADAAGTETVPAVTPTP